MRISVLCSSLGSICWLLYNMYTYLVQIFPSDSVDDSNLMNDLNKRLKRFRRRQRQATDTTEERRRR